MGWPTKSIRRDIVIPFRASDEEADALDDLTTAAGLTTRADTIRTALEQMSRTKTVRKQFTLLQAARQQDAQKGAQ